MYVYAVANFKMLATFTKKTMSSVMNFSQDSAQQITTQKPQHIKFHNFITILLHPIILDGDSAITTGTITAQK